MSQSARKGTRIQTANPRTWFYFALNSEVLTARQRDRILAGIGYR